LDIELLEPRSMRTWCNRYLPTELANEEERKMGCAECYTQPIDKSVRMLVNAVTDDVMSAKKTGPKPLTTRLQ